MNRNKLKLLRPMMLVFIMLNAFFIIAQKWLAGKGVDAPVVIAGNIVMFLVALVSFLLTLRNLKSANPHAFVRGIYSGFLLKFFAVAGAAFVYIASVKEINKPALFICLGLYVVYTGIEVTSLTRLLKQQKNA
jgi:hypothetical protein